MVMCDPGDKWYTPMKYLSELCLKSYYLELKCPCYHSINYCSSSSCCRNCYNKWNCCICGKLWSVIRLIVGLNARRAAIYLAYTTWWVTWPVTVLFYCQKEFLVSIEADLVKYLCYEKSCFNKLFDKWFLIPRRNFNLSWRFNNYFRGW